MLDNDPNLLTLTDPALVDLNQWAALEHCKVLYHLLSFLDGTLPKRPELWRLSHATGLGML